MTYEVFAVYDKAIGAYLLPFYCRNKGEAVRSFMDAVRDSTHQMHRHATDYALFEIGVFDDVSGLLIQDDKVHPVRIMGALECLDASAV